MFFPPEVVQRLESATDIIWNDTGEQLHGEKLGRYIQDADVCITGWGTGRYTSDVLRYAKKLRVIAHTGGSVAGIVSDELYKRGIYMLSGNEMMAEVVAEGTLAYILSALRRISYYEDGMQNKHWTWVCDLKSESLLEQKIGLVGFGAISKFLVRMLVPFRTEIKVYDPYVDDGVLSSYGVTRAGLEEIFRESKVISIHAAKTPDTYHMIGKKLLETVPDGALLINTARSSIIDTAALEEELLKNRFNAVLDVFDMEPLPEDSRLYGLSNVMLLPHMAGAAGRWSKVTLALIKDIERIYDGKQPEMSIGREYAMAMTR